jgi:tetratricopeptide (TPR) repeat protein
MGFYSRSFYSRSCTVSYSDPTRRLIGLPCAALVVARLPAIFAASLSLLPLVSAGCFQSPTLEERRAQIRERASALYVKGDYNRAMDEYLSLFQQDPTDADAAYHLGIIKAKRVGPNESQAGMAELARAVELQPSHREAHLQLSRRYLQAKHLSEAKSHVKAVLSKTPGDAEALRLLGRIAAREQDTRRAIAAFRESLDADPCMPEAYRELATVYERHGDPDAAVTTLRTAVDLLGPAYGIGQDLAALLARTGRLEEAVETYRQILQREPRKETLLLGLADVYKQMRAWDEAEAVYRRLQEAGYAEAQLLVGDVYRESGRSAQARMTYEQVLMSHPDLLFARNRLLDLLIESWNIDEAETQVSAIYNKNPKDVMAWYFDGRIKLLRGKLDRAIDLLRAVVRLSPEFSAAHLQLGLAFIEKGDQGQALQVLTKAVELAPRDAQARITLGRLYLEREWSDLALEHIRAAGRLDPQNPQLALLVADLAFHRKQYGEASDRYQTLRTRLPKDGGIPYRLGRIARVQHDDARAEGLFEEALALNPHATEALTQIVEIKVAQNKVAEARDRVRVQLKASSGHPLFYSLLGRLWMVSGEPSKAEAAFSTAADLINEAGRWASGLRQLCRWYGVAEAEPPTKKRNTIFAAHMALGALHETRADYQKAAERYREVLKLDSQFAPAARHLAQILSVHEQDPKYLDEALSYAQVAREEAPQDPYTADTLGWIYYRKNLRLWALSLLKEAAAALPFDQTVQNHYRLAQEAHQMDGTARVQNTALQAR